MKKSILLLILAINLPCFAQDVGAIKPGATHKNNHSYNEVYMPESKLDTILKKDEQLKFANEKLISYQKLVLLKDQQIQAADSTISMLSVESNYWNTQLLERDQLLEQQRIENLKLADNNKKIKKSRWYFLLAGAVATTVIFIAVK